MRADCYLCDTSDDAGRIHRPSALFSHLGAFLRRTPRSSINQHAIMKLVAIEQPEGVLLKRAEQRPSMVKVDGLWVHQGSAESGANRERIFDDVREERIESILKA
jgi:hypothetical protein